MTFIQVTGFRIPRTPFQWGSGVLSVSCHSRTMQRGSSRCTACLVDCIVYCMTASILAPLLCNPDCHCLQPP